MYKIKGGIFMRNKFSKKLAVLFLSLVMVFTFLPNYFSPSKAKAVTLPYNSGIRDQTATSLSSDAKSYTLEIIRIPNFHH